MRPQERYVSRSRCQGPLGNLSAHATTQASYTVPQSCVCNIVTQLIAFQGRVLRAPRMYRYDKQLIYMYYMHVASVIVR